jgi:competence protein ComEC
LNGGTVAIGRELSVVKYSNKILTILLIVVVLYAGWIGYSCFNHPSMKWTMINVNHTEQQGDAHLIQFKGGKKILIDAGFLRPAEEKLIPFLKKEGVTDIDVVFVTHSHKDHYEGLKAILNNGIRISEVYFKIPDKELCDSEKGWGCDYQDVLNYHELLKEYGVPVKEAVTGMKFDFGNGGMLSILYAYDGVDTPIGRSDINDTSLIIRLEQDGYKILFAGDLNYKLGSYLADTAKDIAADILKVPHHGTDGCAPNKFFEKVSPKLAMIPSPTKLWCSQRSTRIKNWFDSYEIPTYVSGFSGDVAVTIQDERIKIFGELPGVEDCK